MDFCVGTTVVHGTRTGQFNCPNCVASYHLIETEAGPETADLEIACVACGEPFPAREGRNVLKYFLSGKAPRRRKVTALEKEAAD